MSKRERPESWRLDPEAASASGGHVSPDVTSTDAVFEALSAPLPSEQKERRDVDEAGYEPLPPRADVIPRSVPERVPSRGRRPTKRMRPVSRRVRRTVRKLDPWTVLKLSLFFYGIFLIIWLGVVAVVYWLVDAAGLFESIEKFREGFALGEGNFEIGLGTVEKWALLIGLSLSVLASLINVFLAFLYNIASDVVGGLEITFVERDL